MSDRNNDQELEKTTDATADEVTSETETNDAIESVPADSVQFSVTFDDVMTKALLTMVFTAHWHLPKPEKPTRPVRPKQTPSLRSTHPPK